MVEQPDVLLHKRDAEFLCRRKDSRVVLAASWRRDVLGSGPGSPEHVVDERELFSVRFFTRELSRTKKIMRKKE